MRPTISLLTLAAIWAAWPGAARADNIDRKLNAEMPAIIKYLKGKGYKNVGVLRFRAQKGTKKPTFTAGPINGNMATRLENLLVIHGGPSEKEALKVVRDASKTALQARVDSWYSKPAQRGKLFEARGYPLAWKNQAVKPDVFLTGLVKTSPDRSKTTVRIDALDKGSKKLSKVTEFTVPTDRQVVRDMGYNFALTKRQLVQVRAKPRKFRAREADRLVIRAAQDNEPQGPDGPPPEGPGPKNKPGQKNEGTATPDSVGGIEVKLLVDGSPQEIRPATKGQTKWEVESPEPGKKVTFTLKNNGTRTLGVVLKLNGVSTIGQQKDESDKCRKWVIDPGKTYTIEGFYGSDGGKVDNYLPFKVLVGEEARAKREELGDKAGRIEVDVFAQDGGAPDDGMKVSPRGLAPAVANRVRGSYARYRSALLNPSKLKLKVVKKFGKRELIVEGEEKKSIPGLEEVPFDNPTPVAHLEIQVTPKAGGQQPPPPPPEE